MRLGAIVSTPNPISYKKSALQNMIFQLLRIMQYTFLSVSLLRATKHERKIIFVSSVLATEKEDVLFNTSHQKGKLVDLSSYDLLVVTRRATKI